MITATELASALVADLDGARGELPMYRSFLSSIVKAAPLDLHDVNEEAARIAGDSTGRLISELGKDGVRVVAGLVKRGLDQGWTNEELAERIAQHVGLTQSMSASIDAYRKYLIDNGTGRGKARQMSSQRAKDMRYRRALAIAQHETRWALAEAQRRMWAEMLKRGEFRPNVTRRWVTAKDERTCPVCRPLNNTRAPLTGLYKQGLAGPPAHVSCRCTEVVDAKELL